MKIVLQKFIANSGYCSRRRAEELIRCEKILVNGEVAELGARVSEDDDVRIGGKRVRLTVDKVYVKLNKSKGYTCTNRKFIGERNVFELISPAVEARHASPLRQGKLHVVGRLDKDSRGLVLLTNDGDLTQKITHPRFQHEKKYIVEVQSEKLGVKKIIKSFRKGINIGEGDGIVRASDIKYKNNNIFEVILTEGKKRQIRRMFKRVGCGIVDLQRVAIGGLRLGGLKEGEWEYLSEKEIVRLRCHLADLAR